MFIEYTFFQCQHFTSSFNLKIPHFEKEKQFGFEFFPFLTSPSWMVTNINIFDLIKVYSSMRGDWKV